MISDFSSTTGTKIKADLTARTNTDIVLNTRELVFTADNIRLKSTFGKDMGTLGISSGNFILGGVSGDGDLFLRDKKNDMRVHVSGGEDSSVNARTRFYVNAKKASMFLGRDGEDGNLKILDKAGKAAIQLDAKNGAISLTGDIMFKTIGSLLKKIESLEKRIKKLEDG